MFIITISLYSITLFTDCYGATKQYITIAEKPIYQIWQNHYFTDRNSGKTHTIEEVDRYYYKTKVNNMYFDNWSSYDISCLTIIDDSVHEQVAFENQVYTNNWLEKIFGHYHGSGDQVHFYSHKDTALQLGIKLR